MSIVLRAFVDADDDALAEIAADPEVRRWNPLTPDDDPAAWRAKVSGDETSTTFAVADESGRLVGTIALFDIDHDQGTAEIGYRVHRAARGRGFGTAAVVAVADHAFGELGLRRLQLFHAVANPASCRIADRAGFALEGMLRQGYVYGDGAAYDEHLHGRLSHD